jgi:hypothetical protein
MVPAKHAEELYTRCFLGAPFSSLCLPRVSLAVAGPLAGGDAVGGFYFGP